jgi:1-acylglycerone phosphate reductase
MPKSVLITGCSSGIGHALALEFKSKGKQQNPTSPKSQQESPSLTFLPNQKGLRVFATARNPESISDLAEQGIETLSLEVNDIQSINALYDEVSMRTKGSLDFLVNNAGRNYTVPAMHVEIDEVLSHSRIGMKPQY